MDAETIGAAILAVFGVIILVFVVGIFLAFPTMWLWNWLMPVIFELPKINLWQALGLNLLSGILFKNTSLNSKK